MVATVDELFHVVKSNPFIDGIGYFVEVTTRDTVPKDGVESLTKRMRDEFCDHSIATLEGDNVLGLDFHEHILTQGEDADHYMSQLELLLRTIEMHYGIDHLCIEFQFDFTRARAVRQEMDELLQP